MFVIKYIGKKMGIKNLNKYLIKKCSKKAIKRVPLSELSNKVFVIDASIYLYKFIGEDALMENMYLFISKMMYYNITPLFIFDGKPPAEKRELLQKRRLEKKTAENKYKLIQQQLDDASSQHIILENKKERLEELNELKNKFLKVTDVDIKQVKSLMDALGVQYVESPCEADHLCGYLTKDNDHICVSDDMDMFIYGCKYIVRNINLQSDMVWLYNYDIILEELEMSQQEFKEVLILSGTDYNIEANTGIIETFKWFYSYKKDIARVNQENQEGFYDWLLIHTKYIDDVNNLKHLFSYFTEDYLKMFDNFKIEKNKKEKNDAQLQKLLKEEGFVFL